MLPNFTNTTQQSANRVSNTSDVSIIVHTHAGKFQSNFVFRGNLTWEETFHQMKYL